METLTIGDSSAARAAVDVALALRAAGHEALLAGGCVRDRALGIEPKDFDVATDAPPDRIVELFRPTRRVGAQFGVVLVQKRGIWVEVATFRSDGVYEDGRRPTSVRFCTAREDATRRDFTINGMFMDPVSGQVHDYVGGRVDIAARVIRCIGEPAARFAEDHLRLLRAVRFAARLGFEIEPATLSAIRSAAPTLTRVSAERVRDELERMFGHSTRARSFELLQAGGLLPFLWTGAGWSTDRIEATRRLLGRLPAGAGFEACLATLLLDQPPDEVELVCRALACSNPLRIAAVWLVEHAGDLDDPSGIRLANLKRLMARPEFAWLEMMARARFQELPDEPGRSAVLTTRLAGVDRSRVDPQPLVNGEDLIARGVAAGPRFKQLLDELYMRQLDEALLDREQALAALDELIRG